jgi:hypothetical protein
MDTNEMNIYEELQALRDAMAIIRKSRLEIVDVTALWGRLNRAEKYLDLQASALVENILEEVA